MYIRTTIKTLTSAVLILFAAAPVQAQDLLARQAPVDRTMKAVDTVALRTLLNREEAESPSAQLYKEWSNQYAHRATELPDSFRIDLRGFHMPTPSRVITSNFGKRWGRMHKGLDIKVYIGDTIRAAFSGKVRIVGYERKGYGNYVVIRHNNGLETIYGHMSKNLVKENQTVTAGEPIGLGGNTGRSTGSHLHFETRLCGVALNPALMFDFVNQDVTGDYYMFRSNKHESESLAASRRTQIQNSYTEAEVRGEAVPSTSSTAGSTSTTKASARYHKVVRGETLSSIARKRGVTIDKLCKLNKITRKTKIRPGQRLRYS